MSVRITHRHPKSAPSALTRLPSASNLLPLFIPLGERKIAVLPVRGSNRQTCPACPPVCAVMVMSLK